MRNLNKIRLRELLLSTLALPLMVVDATAAWAQETAALPTVGTGESSEKVLADADTAGPDTPTGDPEPSSAISANELAKEISNPVTSLWQLQFQFNNVQLEPSNTPVSEKWVNNLYFQPVMPVSLTDDWNLITRPVISLYNSVPYPTGPNSSDRRTTFGDTVLATVLSPAGAEPWIWGVGPTFIFPTAETDVTGQGKWQVGPAAGGGYITDKFMIAAFAQQWWSVAGDKDRKSTNQMNLLPLVYRFFGDGWSVGYSGTILADWKASSSERWTVPVGLSLGKVVFFGRLPVQFQVAGQYFVEKPTAGPEWNFQLQITPVIPKLINKNLIR